VLYVTHDLRMTPSQLGIILASLNVGVLGGILVTPRVVRQFGLGPTLIVAPVLGYIGAAMVPLAAGPSIGTVALLTLAQALTGVGLIIYDINSMSVRQAVTPDRLLGRVNATKQALTWGTTPIGAVLGGVLGELIGLRPAMACVAIGLWLALPWTLFSPLRTMREPLPFGAPGSEGVDARTTTAEGE